MTAAPGEFVFESGGEFVFELILFWVLNFNFGFILSLLSDWSCEKVGGLVGEECVSLFLGATLVGI